MALQHFYSRVPARVSMYHKDDGFDTFAHSAGLEQEFVERELVPACENKLNKIDSVLIRQCKMPSVYTQFTTRSGTAVQGCFSYLPVDYTGERSAYLSHFLVLSGEEKSKVLSTRKNNALNPELFVRDIDSFRITAPDAAPDRDYPQKPYAPCQESDSKYMLAGFSTDTVRSFLYAVLYSLCGKGKNVCFKLPGEESELSLRSVELFNELLSVMPYQLRAGLSFASYVTDPSQYANCKLRGVAAAFPENSAKCAYIDFETGLVIGVHHDEVVANKAVISFFCQMLEDAELRAEFLAFMERAAETVPSLQSLNLKVLGNLVFLFQCSCGLFPEQEILPGDNSVYDYLCIYEKYRDVLRQEYRIKGYRCLLRYPEGHRAIPKNIFAKVSRLYGAESSTVKRMVMNIVLDLIHTDIMRDKLFTFIRSNFRDEEADMRRIIISDLSRVFYGGFLQSQLLAFFSEQFPEEPEESRTVILEKLLLSIRTPAIRGKILGFIEQHYTCLSESNKDRFYDTVMEMLPECDALADMMIQSVNKLLEGETEARRSDLTGRLLTVLENDCRRKERLLMPMMANYPGFCRDLVIRQVFGPWQTWKVYPEFIALLSQKPVAEKTEILSRIWKLAPQTDPDFLLAAAVEIYRPDQENSDLYLWLELAEQAAAITKTFAQDLHDAVIVPAVTARAWDAFDTTRGEDGLTLLETYADSHPAVRQGERYRQIDDYNQLIAAAEQLDYPRMERQLQSLSEHPQLLPKIAQYLGRYGIHPQTQSAETVLSLEILESLLRDGSAELGKHYRAAARDRAPEQALSLLMAVCGPMSQGGPLLERWLTGSDAGIRAMVAAFADGCGRGAYHHLRLAVPAGTVFGSRVEEAIREHKKANGTFLTKLFGKK